MTDWINSSFISGELSDAHDIVAMKLYQLDDPVDADPAEDRSKLSPSSSFFEPPRDHVDDPKPSAMSGIKMFFLLLLGVLGCVACVVIGIMIYQKQQDNSRKRFYWSMLSVVRDLDARISDRQIQILANDNC